MEKLESDDKKKLKKVENKLENTTKSKSKSSEKKTVVDKKKEVTPSANEEKYESLKKEI